MFAFLLKGSLKILIVATVFVSFRVIVKMLATSISSTFAVVGTKVEEKLHRELSLRNIVVEDEDCKDSTDVDTDYTEDDCISVSSFGSFLPKDRIVAFADEVANGVLEEIVEVESFKEYTRFTAEDKKQADKEWCEKLLEQIDLEKGGVACLQGVVVELAVSAHGYEVVQQAFELARGENQAMLLGEIRGNIRHLARSLYGAEVLQTCLELMRPAAVSFIAAELTGTATELARSEAGQWVLCRIFEYLPQKDIAPLCEQLLLSALDLCSHQFGSLVISHLIDYSSHPYQHRTCGIITLHANVLSKHRVAVPLVKKAQLCLRTN